MSGVTLLSHLRTARYGERPALVTARGEWNHARLIAMVESLVAQLQCSGVVAGDTVIVLGETGVEHLIAQLAVPATGAVCVPLASPVASGRLAAIIDTIGPRVCVVTGSASAPQGSDAIRVALHLDGEALAFSPPAGPAETSANRSANTRTQWSSGSPAVVRFTSGSTGHPKGVVLSHHAVLHTAGMLARAFSLDATHRELMRVSIATSDGWQRVAATLYAGGCVCFSDGPVSLSGMLEDFIGFSATGVFLPPPLMRMLLLADRAKVRTTMAGCRTMEIGSAPVTAHELESLLELLPGVRLFVHYGLTECSRATLLDAKKRPQRLHTSGPASPGTLIEVRDQAGQALPAGERGQIYVTGPQLAQGYWKDQVLTAERFRESWLATGDFGQLDDEGCLSFLGREDNMINCAGHCFFPEEAERELGSVEGVKQYVVIGVPDPRGILHQVPWLFAVPGEPERWTPDLLLRRARQRLPAHMRPRRVLVVPHLPRTASGKPDRPATLALFAKTGE